MYLLFLYKGDILNMNNELNMIIEKVERLKEGINKEFLTLRDSE